MDKEDMIGTPEKALKDRLSQFEVQIKSILMGLDYESSIDIIDKFSNKLDNIVASMEHTIYCRRLVNSIKK